MPSTPSPAMYEALIQALDAGLYVYRLDDRRDPHSLRLLATNAAATRYTGYDVSGRIGARILDIFPALANTPIPMTYAEVVISSAPQNLGEVTYGDVNVAQSIFSTRAFPLPDDCVGVVFENITERKAAQAALRLDELAMKSATVGISISDMRQPDQPLIYVNPAFEKMTGYAADEVLGRNCRFLQGDARDQGALNDIRAALKEGRAAKVTLRNYRKDGTLFYNELTLAPIRDTEGALTHFVGIQNDITERIQSAQRIQEQNETLVKANRELAVARRKADDATRLKSEFLATMSHELRTPLNAIIGYTEIQLAGMTGPLTEEQTDYQRRILTNSENLLNLINDILDLAKIEAGRTEILRKPMQIASFIADVRRQTEGLAKEKGLDYQTTLDPRLPETVISDPERLRQIVLNLISNAIKFTDAGSVHLEISKQGRDAWAIIVTDTGVGIAPHAQEYIFDEFRQVDGTSQRKHGGTGLGLAIVRNLALMMGGNVRLRSTVGQGSTFTVLLPLITLQPEADPDPVGAEASVDVKTLVTVSERGVK